MTYKNGDSVKFKDGSIDTGTVVGTDKDLHGEYYKIERVYIDQRNKRMTHWYDLDDLGI